MKKKRRYCYWCINESTGKEYNFMSDAKLSVGTSIKNEAGQECLILDIAEEMEADGKWKSV